MQRFVVLRHEPGSASDRELHWDFMLEGESMLRTWALESEPAMGSSSAALELPDHRLDYLDYEGPVSGQRGSVTRFDRGTYTAIRQSDDELVIEVNGEQLRGTVTLRHRSDGTLQRRDHGQRWVVAFAAG